MARYTIADGGIWQCAVSSVAEMVGPLWVDAVEKVRAKRLFNSIGQQQL
jgi:hypothetical protein